MHSDLVACTHMKWPFSRLLTSPHSGGVTTSSSLTSYLDPLLEIAVRIFNNIGSSYAATVNNVSLL